MLENPYGPHDESGGAGAKLFELKSKGLEGRFFGGTTKADNFKDSEKSPNSEQDYVIDREEVGSNHSSENEIQVAVGEG